MRTDFREERKWKQAMAYTLAYACKKWHEIDDKSSLCVKTERMRQKDMHEARHHEHFEDEQKQIDNEAVLLVAVPRDGVLAHDFSGASFDAIRQQESTDGFSSTSFLKQSFDPMLADLPEMSSINVDFNSVNEEMLELADVDHAFNNLINFSTSTSVVISENIFSKLEVYAAPIVNEEEAYVDQIEYAPLVHVNRFFFIEPLPVERVSRAKLRLPQIRVPPRHVYTYEENRKLTVVLLY